jgi:hypothetical protein
VNDPLRHGAGERPKVREIYHFTQDAIALGLYGVDTPHGESWWRIRRVVERG